MRRVTLLLSLWLLVAVSLTLNSSLAQPGATKAVSSDLERPIHACEQQVASWRSEERIEIAFVIAVIVFGVIISTLQGLNSRWTKTTTLVLGVATAIITSVNSRVFTADDRTLRRAAFESDAVIRQLWVMADTMNDEHLSQQDRLSLKGDYLKKLLEFQAIGEKLNGTATKNAASEKVEETFGVFARVYAQSNMVVPAWAQNPPSDNISLYYVGKGYDPSLTNAKQYALDDAFHNAVLALRQQAPDASDAALLALIKASAVVQDSSFAYDQKAGNYACYTLLRLSKEVQSIGVKSLPPANKAQSPPARFQSKGWRPGDLMANPSSGMFVLDTAGGVSRLVVDQPASPRIEKLSQLMRTDSGYALTANASQFSSPRPTRTVALFTDTLWRARQLVNACWQSTSVVSV